MKELRNLLKPTIITAKQYDTKISIEIDNSDLDLTELLHAFKTICIGLGYSSESFDRDIVELFSNKEEAIDKPINNFL